MTDQAAGYTPAIAAMCPKRRRAQSERHDADLVWLMNQPEVRRFRPELHARMAGETPARGAGSHSQEEN